jgi:molybdopterin-containing oxidoreductase family membrane subunit
MWLERFVIIVTSLQRDFLPSSWEMYSPTMFDWTMFIGTIGMFFTLIFLFVRFLPIISIFEVRTLLPSAQVAHGHHGAHGDVKHGELHGERPGTFVESVNEAQDAEEK